LHGELATPPLQAADDVSANEAVVEFRNCLTLEQAGRLSQPSSLTAGRKAGEFWLADAASFVLGPQLPKH
jgi:hypothetical protein